MRISLLFVILVFASTLLARDFNGRVLKNGPVKGETPKLNSIQNAMKEAPEPGFEVFSEKPIAKNAQIKATYKTGDHFISAMIDSSRNGFGWLVPGIRSVDRYKSASEDFLLLGYRQYMLSNTSSGIIGATTIDVGNGLQNGTFFRHAELNQDLLNAGTIGGRYPGVVALDHPFIAFNQYKSGDASTSPAISHPYLITDYGSYGLAGGLWAGTYQMDQGYQHENFAENRLWTGSVSIVKDNGGTYHYAGVYNNWTIDGEDQANDYVILNAESADPTGSWTIDTTPALIDTFNYMIYPMLSMNSSGFGACVGLGHQGNDPDNSFYMSELRLMVKTTSDYGKTWSATREVSWAELGIPETVTEADSIPFWDTDTTWHWHVGDVYVAIPNNHAIDVVVSENNDIYVGFDLTWGPTEDGQTYYRDAAYCGTHAAISNDGGNSFWDSHIAVNNGFFEGDSSSDAVDDNFVFDSEVDISLDELGNVYATWLDRPSVALDSVEIEPAEHLRYDRTNQEMLLKTDVFTARSENGGSDWTWRMDVTKTKSVDEYELKAALAADSRDNGTVFFAYNTIDPATPVGQGDADAYTYRVNRISVGQAFNYPQGTAISNESSKVIENFTLEQNYPNPFNPTTTIRYDLRTAGMVDLAVYNMLGQRVQTLVNSRQNRGVYEVEFDASALASGVYMYRLSSGNRTSVRKMVLLK